MDNTLAEIQFADAYVFLFHQDELLIKESNGLFHIPFTSDVKDLLYQPSPLQSIGLLQDCECFLGTITPENIPLGFTFIKVKPLYGKLEDDSFQFACRAFHIMNWMNTHKFCGCCSGTMAVFPQEIAMKCSLCGHLVYPRISPAIIVAVTRGTQLLLARAKHFPPNRYSVIAGFVEPGETLEECVRRELQEEVGIEVHDINYFGSQPWPFPDSLMVAFTAQCSCEKITIDNNEIVAADWFSADKLPTIPDKPSVGRQLIDWFIEKNTPPSNI